MSLTTSHRSHPVAADASAPLVAAARLLLAVERGESLAEALPPALAALPASTVAPAQLKDYVYGSLRHRSRLEHHLVRLVPRRPEPALLRALLLVGLYRLAHSKTPPHAVVCQTVDAVRAAGFAHAAGFANAVLRNFLRRRAELETAADRRDDVRFSLPRWWVDRLRTQYPERYREIMACCLSHPPMGLRVNRRKLSRESYAAMLAQAGIEATAAGEDGLVLARPLPVARLPGFGEGQVSVQDTGAQRAVEILAPRDGSRVLDASAAPGGKTGHLLERADIELTAVDVDGERLERVAENLQRLGLSARLIAADARHPERWWDERPFDAILADVPCSASGVVRRHPDAKWLRRPEDLAAFARLAGEMLRALWPLLRPGGKLLYATCSLFNEENDAVVDEFLARHGDARPLPFPGAPRGRLQLLPCSMHDGFFYALLAKRT